MPATKEARVALNAGRTPKRRPVAIATDAVKAKVRQLYERSRKT
jgi:hypothetical protein